MNGGGGLVSNKDEKSLTAAAIHPLLFVATTGHSDRSVAKGGILCNLSCTQRDIIIPVIFYCRRLEYSKKFHVILPP